MSLERGPRPPQGEWLEDISSYEPAIKKFIADYFAVPLEERPSYGLEFDISDPKIKDAKNMASGDFEVGNVRVFSQSDGTKDYHCYVGRTEFHITGKPAEEISALINVPENIPEEGEGEVNKTE